MKQMTNLIRHARTELEAIGEEQSTIAGYLKVVEAFAAMGHSGGSASVAIPVIHKLLQFKPLTALTDDPEEWHFVSKDMWNGKEGIWQNKRDGEAFSTDGGKTYYRLSEGGSSADPKPLHKSARKES